MQTELQILFDSDTLKFKRKFFQNIKQWDEKKFEYLQFYGKG